MSEDAAGAESSALFATLDFLPTFANLAGFDVPGDRVIDGVDQTELLSGTKPMGARTTFLYQTNGLRRNEWKYLKAKHDVAKYAADKNRPEVEELYNLTSDPGETKNLAAASPEKVAELKKLMTTIIGSGKKLSAEDNKR
jgi:arylsulfatase A